MVAKTDESNDNWVLFMPYSSSCSRKVSNSTSRYQIVYYHCIYHNMLFIGISSQNSSHCELEKACSFRLNNKSLPSLFSLHRPWGLAGPAGPLCEPGWWDPWTASVPRPGQVGGDQEEQKGGYVWARSRDKGGIWCPGALCSVPASLCQPMHHCHQWALYTVPCRPAQTGPC